MSTNRQLVSSVRATHRLLSGDAAINDRVILAELRRNALTLINQKTNQRKFWQTDTIFTPLDCVEMIEIPVSACCDYASDRLIARSKHKLPTIAEGYYQYLISGVFDVDASQNLKFMPLKRWINTLKLQLVNKDVYFFMHNDYLIITNPFTKVVSISAAFDGDIPYELLYPECDCGPSRKTKVPCTSRLDESFKCPSTLEGTVIDMTSVKLLSTYFKVPNDATSDNLDTQANIK